MRIISYQPNYNDAEVAKALADAMRSGKVAAFPTDTVYGIGCRADDRRAIQRIYRLKKRVDPKLPLLVSSITMAKRYVRIAQAHEALLREYWPGELTVILPSKRNLPYVLEGGTQTLAVRIPNNDWLRSVIRRLGVPLVATSANVSGQPSVVTPEELQTQMKQLPDVFIAGPKPRSTKPSTLIDLTEEEMQVLRKGVVAVSSPRRRGSRK